MANLMLRTCDNIAIGGDSGMGGGGAGAADVGVGIMDGRKRHLFRNDTASPLIRLHALTLNPTNSNSFIVGVRVHYQNVGNGKRVVAFRSHTLGGDYWSGGSVGNTGSLYVECVWDAPRKTAMVFIGGSLVHSFTPTQTGAFRIGASDWNSATSSDNRHNLLAQNGSQMAFSDYYQVFGLNNDEDILDYRLGSVIVRARQCEVVSKPTNLSDSAITGLTNDFNKDSINSDHPQPIPLKVREGKLVLNISDGFNQPILGSQLRVRFQRENEVITLQSRLMVEDIVAAEVIFTQAGDGIATITNNKVHPTGIDVTSLKVQLDSI